MGWIGLSLLISIITLAFIYFKARRLGTHQKDEYMLGGAMSLFISLLVIGIVGGMYTGTTEGRRSQGDFTGCYASVNHWDIVSAVRDKTTTSSFILGTGGSRTIDKYYVYRVEDEGLMLTNYNAHKTYVIEQDGTPAYARIDHVCPMPVYDFLWWSTGNEMRNYGKKGTLYVPRDTILREFKM